MHAHTLYIVALIMLYTLKIFNSFAIKYFIETVNISFSICQINYILCINNNSIKI